LVFGIEKKSQKNSKITRSLSYTYNQLGAFETLNPTHQPITLGDEGNREYLSTCKDLFLIERKVTTNL
jgi:hypothetical protein